MSHQDDRSQRYWLNHIVNRIEAFVQGSRQTVKNAPIGRMGYPSLSWLAVITVSVALAAMGMVPSTAKAQLPPITGNVQQSQQGLNQQAGPENVMIILDSSYSMSEPIEQSGENKMIAAKRTVLDVLRNISPRTRVGLRVYGNSANQFTACKATSLLVPLGENNRNLIASKMIGLRPTGATPISYTVLRSLQEDFNAVNGTHSIILISDGIETCGEDPCDVAVKMQQMGIHIKINVIGLGLQDYAAVKQLRCVALATKGQFYTANTAAELANSLNKALAVETNVQGTVIQHSQNPVVPMPQSVQPPVATPRTVTVPEVVLPAAVPIESNKR
ncbi:vWA domain-containing protein [Vampirovibrio chlorellavorus]|uniref:vWA domain-containing protein n=1 Tax=Vampirovibrio chlorellavorus TaxID=758823 RepID=UPI0026EA91A9|nr:VWA domain-containing protein [Vampirovibrio chlorellavorus]